MTGPPLIDRAALDELVAQIGTDAVRSVLALFLDEADAYRAAIIGATAHETDAAAREQARRAAHSLKSSAGQIGAAALSAAAASVEQGAVENDPDLALAAAALERCAADTVEALRPLLA